MPFFRALTFRELIFIAGSEQRKHFDLVIGCKFDYLGEGSMKLWESEFPSTFAQVDGPMNSSWRSSSGRIFLQPRNNFLQIECSQKGLCRLQRRTSAIYCVLLLIYCSCSRSFTSKKKLFQHKIIKILILFFYLYFLCLPWHRNDVASIQLTSFQRIQRAAPQGVHENRLASIHPLQKQTQFSPFFLFHQSAVAKQPLCKQLQSTNGKL